jgi:hypothetical protein
MYFNKLRARKRDVFNMMNVRKDIRGAERKDKFRFFVSGRKKEAREKKVLFLRYHVCESLSKS